MAYISNYLTHWLGRNEESDDCRFKLLKKILKDRALLYGRCGWNFSSKWGGINNPENFKIPMICFTDIPFSESLPHREKYSSFGISFDKGYLVQCLAAPVGYAINPEVFEAYSALYKSISALRNTIDVQNISRSSDGPNGANRITADYLLGKLQTIANFHQNLCLEEFIFNTGEDFPIEREVRKVIDQRASYYEREWRMIFSEGKNRKWEICTDGARFFKFRPEFVRYLILPRKFVGKINSELKGLIPEGQMPEVLASEDLHEFDGDSKRELLNSEIISNRA